MSQIFPRWNSIDLTPFELSYTGDEFGQMWDILFIFSFISFSLEVELELVRGLQCKWEENKILSVQE